MDPFQAARELVRMHIDRHEKKRLREELAKILVQENKGGVQVRTDGNHMARVVLATCTCRPCKRVRVERLAQQLRQRALDIAACAADYDRLVSVSQEIMREVDHREPTTRQNVTVHVTPLLKSEAVSNEIVEKSE